LLNLLKASTYSAILSAFSVCALLARNDPVATLGDGCDLVKQFLLSALALESELTAPAVRLVGVLASTLSGSALLEEWDVMLHVGRLLNSENQELNHLAVMALTAMSAASPDSQAMLESIPLLFEACKDASFGFYPLICLSNITVDPLSAAACVPHLPELFVHFKDENPLSVQRAIVTIYRVLVSPEAVESFEKPEVIKCFLDAGDELWTSEHAPIFFDIIETLTANSVVCGNLKACGIMDSVKSMLASCQLNDPNRPKFIRIRARLMAVGN
jgi:hypothetical protein